MLVYSVSLRLYSWDPMSKTFGGKSRRYIGEKLYYAAIATFKARELLDDGIVETIEPLKLCVRKHGRCDCVECQEYDRMLADQDAYDSVTWDAHCYAELSNRSSCSRWFDPHDELMYMYATDAVLDRADQDDLNRSMADLARFQIDAFLSGATL